MPARDYADLGGVGGVQDNPPQDYSPRGKDLDRVQTFVFEDDPADPFIGTIHLQGSNDAPLNTTPASERIWADLVELTFDGVPPIGNFFVQTDIEVAQVRIVCKAGNYTSGRLTAIRTMR